MRKFLLVLAAATVPCLAMAVVPESTIKVRPNGNDGFHLALKSARSANVEEGQRELQKKARELCKGKHPAFGKYTFLMNEPVGAAAGAPKQLELQQELHCVIVPATVPQATPVAPASGAALANAEQIKRVERQATQYFAARDQGRYQQAYDMMAASQKATASFAQFKARGEAFNAQAGAVQNRTIKKITWYRDPPQVTPGLYAAVDFTGEFANLALHCGFVAWHLQPDGSFHLVREEENLIDRATAQRMQPGNLNQARAQFGCK